MKAIVTGLVQCRPCTSFCRSLVLIATRRRGCPCVQVGHLGVDPAGIGIDSSGNLYVADANNDTIREVTQAGVVTTIAGSPEIQEDIDALERFFRDEAQVLASAIEMTGYESYPVPQIERDPLFLRFRAR